MGFTGFTESPPTGAHGLTESTDLVIFIHLMGRPNHRSKYDIDIIVIFFLGSSLILIVPPALPVIGKPCFLAEMLIFHYMASFCTFLRVDL